jgi:hypothetical protein
MLFTAVGLFAFAMVLLVLNLTGEIRGAAGLVNLALFASLLLFTVKAIATHRRARLEG